MLKGHDTVAKIVLAAIKEIGKEQTVVELKKENSHANGENNP